MKTLEDAWRCLKTHHPCDQQASYMGSASIIHGINKHHTCYSIIDYISVLDYSVLLAYRDLLALCACFKFICILLIFICVKFWFLDVIASLDSVLSVGKWVIILLYYLYLSSPKSLTFLRDAFQKKNCPEWDIVLFGREGGKKNPIYFHNHKWDINGREGGSVSCLIMYIFSKISLSKAFFMTFFLHFLSIRVS